MRKRIAPLVVSTFVGALIAAILFYTVSGRNSGSHQVSSYSTPVPSNPMPPGKGTSTAFAEKVTLTALDREVMQTLWNEIKDSPRIRREGDTWFILHTHRGIDKSDKEVF